MTNPRHGLPSASGMERLFYCPGSAKAEGKMASSGTVTFSSPSTPPELKSDVAATGTRIHAALEKGDRDKLSMHESEIVDRLRIMEAKILADWKKDKGIPETDGLDVQREKRFWLEEGGAALCSAQPDVVYRHYVKNAALIINYKTGFKETTEAARNWQCKAEAVCVNSSKACDSIRVAVAQFRLRGFNTAADYDNPVALDMATDDILDVLARASAPIAPRAAGAWCQYCTALSNCRYAAVQAMLPLTVPNVEGLTLANAKALWDKRNIITDTIDAITTRLKGTSNSDLRTIGLELGKGRELRNIKDPEGLLKLLTEFGFIDLPGFLAMAKVSRTEIHSYLLSKFLKSQSPEEAEKCVEDMLAPFTETATASPSLKKIKK